MIFEKGVWAIPTEMNFYKFCDVKNAHVSDQRCVFLWCDNNVLIWINNMVLIRYSAWGC